MKPLHEWIGCLFDPIPKRILFRVDAGRKQGLSFGHASRCLILAKVLRTRYKSQVLFLMQDYPEGIEYVRNHDERVQVMGNPLDSQQELQELNQAIQSFQPDWIVFDIMDIALVEMFVEKKQEFSCHTLYLDDCNFQVPPVDRYLNSHILAPKKIQPPYPEITQLFLGPEYFLFDTALLEDKPVKLKDAFHVVVTFGGSDPANLTQKSVTALSQENWCGVHFTVILGPGYSEKESIKKMIQQGECFSIVSNPPNLIPYLQGCDYVICAGGRTLYELLYLKKPFFPIPSIEHEIEPVEEVRRLGLHSPRETQYSPYIDQISHCLSSIQF